MTRSTKLFSLAATALAFGCCSSSLSLVRADAAALGVIAREIGLRGVPVVLNTGLGGGGGPVGGVGGGGGEQHQQRRRGRERKWRRQKSRPSSSSPSSLGGRIVDRAAAALGSASAVEESQCRWRSPRQQVGFKGMMRKFFGGARPAVPVATAPAGGSTTTTSGVGGGGRKLKQSAATSLLTGASREVVRQLGGVGGIVNGGLGGLGNGGLGNGDVAAAGSSSSSPTLRLPSTRTLRFGYNLARPLINGFLRSDYLPALAAPASTASNVAAGAAPNARSYWRLIFFSFLFFALCV